MSVGISRLFDAPNQQYLFVGYVTAKVLDSMAAGIEEVMAVRPDTSQKVMKVFSIYVEMLQNVMFYSKDRLAIQSGGDAAYGGIEVAIDDGAVALTAINPISMSQRESLQVIIDEITGSSPEELVALYKRKMMSGFESEESRGGGLGYYDIARRSSREVHFEFIEHDKAGLLFKITAWI